MAHPQHGAVALGAGVKILPLCPTQARQVRSHSHLAHTICRIQAPPAAQRQALALVAKCVQLRQVQRVRLGRGIVALSRGWKRQQIIMVDANILAASWGRCPQLPGARGTSHNARQYWPGWASRHKSHTRPGQMQQYQQWLSNNAAAHEHQPALQTSHRAARAARSGIRGRVPPAKFIAWRIASARTSPAALPGAPLAMVPQSAAAGTRRPASQCTC